MTLLFLLVAIGVVGAVAVLIARDEPLLAEDPTTAPAFDWPPAQLAPADLADVRFAVAVRGYRMDQVDQVLDDAREALRVRDEQIRALQAGPSPEGVDETEETAGADRTPPQDPVA